MNKSEISLLLAAAASYDRRTIGEADVEAWHAALDDIDHTDATRAVVNHYRTSTTWLMPSHVREGVRRIREQRLANADLAAPPADPDARDYSRQLREHIAALADGRTIPPALRDSSPDAPTEDYRAARAEHAPPPPPEPPANWCGRCDSEARVQYELTDDGTGLRAVPCPVCQGGRS